MRSTTILVLKWVAALTLAFTVCISLIHARPYDDARSQALVAPADGCPMPCFMGIQPGFTTSQAAVRLLERHDWVEKVTHHIWFGGPNRTLYSWSWSGSQPAFINAGEPGVFSTHGNVVDTVQITTTIPLGDFWLLNQPQLSRVTGEPGHLSYRASYLDGALEITTVQGCPLRIWGFWRARVQMKLTSDTPSDPAIRQFPVWFDPTACP